MRIININSYDCANYSYEFSRGLNAVGLNSSSYILYNHPFGYKKESELISKEDMKVKISEADIVNIMHQDRSLLEICKEVYDFSTHKKLINVFYTGTAYRQNPPLINSSFNPYIDFSIITHGEFSGLGAKNEVHIISGCLDIESISFKSEFNSTGKRTIGHFPSNVNNKGTSIINQVIDNVTRSFSQNITYLHSVEIVPHEKNLERVRGCDIYLELYAPEQNGKPYGSFGISALEAAAMGIPVISNLRTKKLYEQIYGSCPIIDPMSVDNLYDVIIELLFMNDKNFSDLKLLFRKWTEKSHSLLAMGNQFKQKVINA